METSVGGVLFTVVSPDPIGESGTLLIHAEDFTGRAFVSIFDLSGRLISSTEIAVTSGEGGMPVARGEFAAGVYVYSVYLQNGESLSGKFSVQ